MEGVAKPRLGCGKAVATVDEVEVRAGHRVLEGQEDKAASKQERGTTIQDGMERERERQDQKETKGT